MGPPHQDFGGGGCQTVSHLEDPSADQAQLERAGSSTAAGGGWCLGCLSRTAGRRSGKIEQNEAMDGPIHCHPSKRIHGCLFKHWLCGDSGEVTQNFSLGAYKHRLTSQSESPGFRVAHSMLGIQAEAQGKTDTGAQPGH